jgi:hypothetical protein
VREIFQVDLHVFYETINFHLLRINATDISIWASCVQAKLFHNLQRHHICRGPRIQHTIVQTKTIQTLKKYKREGLHPFSVHGTWCSGSLEGPMLQLVPSTSSTLLFSQKESCTSPSTGTDIFIFPIMVGMSMFNWISSSACVGLGSKSQTGGGEVGNLLCWLRWSFLSWLRWSLLLWWWMNWRLWWRERIFVPSCICQDFPLLQFFPLILSQLVKHSE